MSISSSLFLKILMAFSVSAMEPDLDDHISVRVDNIGQGNFIRVEIPYKTEPKKAHIIVDCGSSSYEHEFYHIFKRRKKTGPRLTLDKLLQKKRRALGGVKGEPLYIMGLILTHPDSDHIDKLDKLFTHKKDRIDYIICGGLPEMHQKKTVAFGKWIDRFIKKRSKVYFPAISYEPIKNFREVLSAHPESYQPYKSWAEHKFTSEDYKRHPFPEFYQALKAINNDFRLYFLAVNPTHVTGAGGTVRLTNATAWEEKEKETNTDSLVLKISYKNASMILPGDATEVTTSRIQSNYSARFLESPVLLLAHHGAVTEGSNNELWLNIVQPKYILISAGHKFGHPHKEALQRFRSLESLKNVTSHQISWTKIGTRRKKTMIKEAIFLTYESGDLITKLCNDGTVKLTTQIEKEIKELAEPPPSSSYSSRGTKRSRPISEKEPQPQAKSKKAKSKEHPKIKKKTSSSSSGKKLEKKAGPTGKEKGKEKKGRK